MADVKWIKITTDIFDDEKMLLIEGMPSADSIITIWLKLLILAGKQNNNGVFLMNDTIPYTDEMLAIIFRRDIQLVRLALNTFQQFGMIDVIDNVITIPKWNKHQSLDTYERKREYDRQYQAKRREFQKSLVKKSYDSSYDVVVLEEDIDKDIDNNIYNGDSKSENDLKKEFFESIWKLYPKKKGKGNVSKTKINALYKIGYDEIARCVDRYVTEFNLSGKNEQYMMYGGTFFNSGYVDYLDCNYLSESKPAKKEQLPFEPEEDAINNWDD